MTVTDPAKASTLHITWKLKFLFIGFGVAAGLAAANLLAHFLIPNGKAREFSSIDDFRGALNDQRADGKHRRKNGSLPFAAVIVPEPDDKLIYTLKPHLNDNFTGVTVRTNSQGMRSPERPIEKPPSTYRLAVLGERCQSLWPDTGGSGD